MREIKFRVWDSFNAVMAFSDKARSLSGFVGMYEMALSGKNNPLLMQFSGLRDANDVEIYEGDIVASSSGSWGHGEVLFRNTAFRVHAYILCELKKPEVIGNIYENPELLKS